MSFDTIEFQLVSPEKVVISRPVYMVVMPGKDGYFGVSKDHAPFITSLNPGVVYVYDDETTISSRILVAGGFAEVTNQRCTLLSDDAVDTMNISLEMLQNTIKDLEEKIAESTNENRKIRFQERLTTAKAMLEAYEQLPQEYRMA